MTFAWPAGSVLHLPDGRTVPLLRMRIVYTCSVAACANKVRHGGPPRCAVHATRSDVGQQVRARIFQADQVLAFFLARKWGRA